MNRRWCFAVQYALVLAAMVALALGLAAGTVAAQAGPTFRGDPQAVAEVTAALQKFSAARSWRTRMTSPEGTSTTEFVAPDRFRMVLTQGNTTTEIFIIGRETWVRGGGDCRKVPGTTPVTNPKDLAELTGADTITVTRGNPEMVDGTPTQTYTMAVESRGATTRQKLHVATATGLLRRIEVQASQGTMLVDYFDFGAPITINPPC